MLQNIDWKTLTVGAITFKVADFRPF